MNPSAPPRILTFLVATGCASGAAADIIAIDPFTGMSADTFDQYNQVMAEQSLPVFAGLGALQNLSQGGAIKVEWASQFSGKWVRAISGMMAGQLGIAQWVFDVPVTHFGGWWETNSGQPNATLAFYDARNNFLGERIARIPFPESGWTWNGWTSDVPIHRIVVTGNGVINGFVWYENMQINYVPGPASMGPLAIAGLIARRRRRGTP